MTRYYIFDMDGTLTPSRSKIDLEFAVLFKQFAQQNRVIIVTGSNRTRTLDQLGDEICNLAIRVYTCGGNELMINDELIRKEPSFELPDYIKYWLTGKMKESKFVLRTGNHIEHNTGIYNFSILGRNATLGERILYKKWDAVNQERLQLVKDFNICFSYTYQAVVGGETSIDITLKNKDKSQILKDFTKADQLTFFGDEVFEYGNDHTIADKIKERGGVVHSVSSWQDTASILNLMQSGE